MSRYELSRRTVLRGVGVSMALPMLDAMLTRTAAAATAPAATSAAGASSVALTAAGTPKRMCMVFMPNGVSFKDWMPEGLGADWKPSPTLRPLMDVKEDVCVMSGLALDNAR